MKWIQDILFIIEFRMKKRIKRLTTKKVEPTLGEVMDQHRVKIIDHKGRFMLLECIKCGDRELAIDKYEAIGIYSRTDCIGKGGE